MITQLKYVRFVLDLDHIKYAYDDIYLEDWKFYHSWKQFGLPFFLICLTFILLSKMCVTFLFIEENNSLLKENVRLPATNIGGMQWQICGGAADCKESPIQNTSS